MRAKTTACTPKRCAKTSAPSITPCFLGVFGGSQQASQAECRGFESLCPLLCSEPQMNLRPSRRRGQTIRETRLVHQRASHADPGIAACCCATRTNPFVRFCMRVLCREPTLCVQSHRTPSASERPHRGVLPLVEAGEALGGRGGHDFGWAGTMMRPVFGSPKLAHSSPLAAW